MPNISAARLRELEFKSTEHDRYRDELTAERMATAQFDRILDKVIRAGRGWPINESPNRGDFPAAGMDLGGRPVGRELFVDGGCGHVRAPTDAERHEAATADRDQRIVSLESRLAAALAVAAFAKDHKA